MPSSESDHGELNRQEAEAGFVLAEVEDRFSAGPRRAVVYLSSSLPGFRLVKVASLEGGLAYQVQGRGRFNLPGAQEAQWFALADLPPGDPARAVEGMDEAIAQAIASGWFVPEEGPTSSGHP